MFFDRNEIHIPAFQEIPPGKWISRNSSSSTFILSSYYHILKSENQKSKKKKRKFKQRSWGLVHKTSGNFEIFRFSDFQNPYFPRMFQYFSCIFWNNLMIIGRATGPYFDNFLEVPEIIKKVLESIRNRYLAILEYLKPQIGIKIPLKIGKKQKLV